MADCFIKFDQIAGESQDKDHAAAILVDTWTWGGSWVGSHAGKGERGGGDVRAFTFSHGMDSASPALLMRCLIGKEIPKAKLIMRRAGGPAQTYLEINFSKVRLLSVTLAHDKSHEVPAEQVSFSFDQVEYQYTPQGARGGAGGGASTMTWRAATDT